MTEWTNYETERVFTDFFEGGQWIGETPETLCDYVLDTVIAHTDRGVARYYATLFVGEVDWLQLNLYLNERKSA